MFLPVFVGLFVSLLTTLLKNAWMDLDKMLRVDKCRDMYELINFSARSGSNVSDICFQKQAFPGTGLLLRHRISYTELCSLAYTLPASCAATLNFTSEKAHLYIRAVVLK